LALYPLLVIGWRKKMETKAERIDECLTKTIYEK